MSPACVCSAGDGDGKIDVMALVVMIVGSVMTWAAAMAIHGVK